MAYSGKYRPINPRKYIGDHTNIIYRSTWERKVMAWLDRNPSVLQWGSEEFSIPYVSPVDGRVHRYFPDFVVKFQTKDSSVRTMVIEVKPEKETREPKVRKRMTKQYLYEVKTWGVNQAKWKAAEEFCADRKWDFKVLTEKDVKF